MKRRHIVIGAVSAALLAVGGAAPAASAHSTHAAHHGVEHILALQSGANGPEVVIANGPIHAQGKDVSISNNRDRFVFPKGSLLIWHKAKTSHQSFDPKTCLGTFSESGVFKVVGGSGRYDDATGHGKYTLHGYAVGCAQNKPPKVFQLTIDATGPISY
jgi:hypothetical protein